MRFAGHALAIRIILAMTLATTFASAFPAGASARKLTLNPPDLSPTFPNDTGAIATTAVGQQTGVYWSFEYPQNWQIDSNAKVYLVSVAHVSDPTNCSQTPGAILIYTEQSTGSGILNLSYSFTWPNNATIAAGGQYYAVCLHPTHATGAGADVYSYDGGPLDNTNKTVYRVLSDLDPIISVSPTSVYDGQTVTVTGRNWKYYYYPDLQNGGTSVLLVQYPSSQTYRYVETVIPQVDHSTGNFTVQFHIHETPGDYFVCVGNAFFTGYSVGGGVKVRVLSGSPPTGEGGSGGGSGGATPTATAAMTATASAGSSATATTNTPDGASQPKGALRKAQNGSQADTIGWITLIVAVLFSLAAIAGATIYVLRRRRATGLRD